MSIDMAKVVDLFATSQALNDEGRDMLQEYILSSRDDLARDGYHLAADFITKLTLILESQSATN